MTLPKNIYMVGIGGIGMSALAQYLVREGHIVSGSDRSESQVTAILVEQHILVHIGQTESHVPNECELLIYSDAIPPSNLERTEAVIGGVPQLSYFEALGVISKNMRTIAVAGTHGKTTTTGMLAKIAIEGGERPTVIVGSIIRDFGSNFVAGRPDLLIVEACEYRDHLLKLNPEILVINNIELDHTDYFPDIASLQETFRIAAHKVPTHGYLITNTADKNIKPILDGVSAHIVDYRDTAVPPLQLIGEFNQMNARAAAAAARAAFPNITDDVINHALTTFAGAWRRFEYHGITPSGAVVYDDYAHHPTAIKKTIEGAREKFPNKRIVIAFHPHLYSRTKSLLNEFAHALAKADCAIVAPIYAAREAADLTVSNHILAALSTSLGGNVVALDTLDAVRGRLLKEGSDTLIITMGAGDIYKVATALVHPVLTEARVKN